MRDMMSELFKDGLGVWNFEAAGTYPTAASDSSTRYPINFAAMTPPEPDYA